MKSGHVFWQGKKKKSSTVSRDIFYHRNICSATLSHISTYLPGRSSSDQECLFEQKGGQMLKSITQGQIKAQALFLTKVRDPYARSKKIQPFGIPVTTLKT